MTSKMKTRQLHLRRSVPYPCISCLREVRPKQHALQCETCERWQHRTCNTGITQDSYRQAIKSKCNINWSCSTCDLPNSPLPNSRLPNASIPNSSLPHTPVPNSPLPNSPLPNSPLPNVSLPNSHLPNTPVPNSPLPNFTALPRPSFSPVPNSPIPDYIPNSLVPKLPNFTVPNYSATPIGLPIRLDGLQLMIPTQILIPASSILRQHPLDLAAHSL